MYSISKLRLEDIGMTNERSVMHRTLRTPVSLQKTLGCVLASCPVCPSWPNGARSRTRMENWVLELALAKLIVSLFGDRELLVNSLFFCKPHCELIDCGIWPFFLAIVSVMLFWAVSPHWSILVTTTTPSPGQLILGSSGIGMTWSLGVQCCASVVHLGIRDCH